MQDILPIIGVEVGKHLGLVNALPLRTVCREWRDTLTLTAVEAEIDLEPDAAEDAAALARRQLFLKRCPRLRKLTCHVSPGVSLAKFERDMGELAGRLTCLEELVLLFNNPGQTFESRHLAVLGRLSRLRSLTLQASFHPDACSFAALAPLTSLASLTVLPAEAATGLTDGHVASLARLGGLVELRFPGHARAFTGTSLGALSSLPRLASLSVTSNKHGAVDYSLSLPALAGLRALVRRPGAAPPLALELGVPDAAFGAALLRAVSGPGLACVALAVREAADSDALAGLLGAPGAAGVLSGLDLEFRGAPSGGDVAALAAVSRLERLHVTCKCPRPPAERLDVAPWLRLSRLRHLHLHINPAWRAPLQPRDVAAMAAAWPALEHLHLRLSPADNATHALAGLGAFKALTSLSLTWLGQAAPASPPAPGGARRRTGGSLEGASLSLAGLPPGLQELALTSISTVRLALPGGGAPAPALPALRSLLLDGAFGLSDELLAGLAAAAPGLSSLALVLTGRQALSGAGLGRLAAALPRLCTLLVNDYREAPACLSQEALAGLAGAGLGRLRHLKLSTPDVVHAELRPAAFAGFTKLRRLDLVGCQDQAEAALAADLPLCCIKARPEWAADVAGPPPAAHLVPALAA